MVIPNLIIHSEYSKHLESIFEETDIEDQNAMDFLFKNSSIGSNEFSQIQNALQLMIGDTSIQYDLNSHLLISEYILDFPDGRKKSLDVQWEPITEDDQIERMMIIIRDNTKLKVLELEAKKQKEELILIGEILGVSPTQCYFFIKETLEFLDRNQKIIQSLNGTTDLKEVLNPLFRNIHTIKGNARLYGFETLSDISHDVESKLIELKNNEGSEWNEDILLADNGIIRQHLEKYTTILESKLNRTESQSRETELIKNILNQYDSSEKSLAPAILEDIKKIVLKEDLAEFNLDIVQELSKQLPKIAKALNKPSPNIQASQELLFLGEKKARILKDILGHCIRNALDHGIEPPEQRTEKGKDRCGTISIHWSRSVEAETLKFRVYDDGKGLNLGALRKNKAKSSNLSDIEVSELIFLPGLSTAEETTAISGRGIGMDAVRQFITEIGGSVKIAFTDNLEGQDFRNFELIITIPENEDTEKIAA